MDPSDARNTLLDGFDPSQTSEGPGGITGHAQDPAALGTTPSPTEGPAEPSPSSGLDPGGVDVQMPESRDPGVDVQMPESRDPGADTTGGTLPTGPMGTPPPAREAHRPVPAVNVGAAGPEAPPPAYTPPPIGANPDTTAFNQRLRQFLLSQLDTLSTPTDENDPNLAPSITAYRNQSQRDQQALRDQQAERFYAQGNSGGEGLSSGGFNTALTRDAEAAGASRANFTGSLVYNASQQKRQQLQAMLQTAVNAGETDAAQQIQAQIAAIDAGLKNKGLDQSNQNFNDSLSARYAELKAQMNRDQIISALGG